MLNQIEIADVIVSLTRDYTDEYFATFQKSLDKQQWAALHLGFIVAMKLNGYGESVLNAALSDALLRIPD
jgi:hypothetical protein